jgi:hypothetical protein
MDIKGIEMLAKLLIFCLLVAGTSFARASPLTTKSVRQVFSASYEAVRLPDATNGAPWTHAIGVAYGLSQYEKSGEKVKYRPYLDGRVEFYYQNDATRYDSDRSKVGHAANFDLSVPLKSAKMKSISFENGFIYEENRPEIQDLYIEIFSGIGLDGGPANIRGLSFKRLVGIAYAEYEVDDEVGFDFGTVGREQLKHRGVGGKLQLSTFYTFGSSRLFMELTHLQVNDDEWGGNYTRSQFEFSYAKLLSDTVDCGIKAIYTDNDYNNNVLGFDDAVLQVRTTCNWAI